MMDPCKHCRKYHHESAMCDEYIEQIKKGKMFCYKCCGLTFNNDEGDRKKCGISRTNWAEEQSSQLTKTT